MSVRLITGGGGGGHQQHSGGDNPLGSILGALGNY